MAVADAGREQVLLLRVELLGEQPTPATSRAE